MAGPSVQERALAALRAFTHDAVEGSVLYLDAGASEAAAAGIGLAALQDELGAALVSDLSAVAPTDLSTAQLLSGGPVRSVAFFITSLLGQAEAALLAACEQCPAAAQFTVLCCVSEAAHHDEAPAAYPSGCYAALAAAWQHRLNERRRPAGGGPCSLAIRHCPVLLCPLTSTAFVLPPSSAAAALPHVGQLAAGFSPSVAAAAADSDEDEPQPAYVAAPARGSGSGGGGGAPAAGLSLLAHALVDAAAVLGCRPEAFSLGPCSRLVCDAMAFVPAAAGELGPAALVLVDRALDLISPAQHADLLLQRMFDQLSGAVPGPSSTSSGGATSSLGGASGPPPYAPPFVPVPMPSLDTPGEQGAGGGSEGGAEAGRGAASLLPGSLQHPDDAQVERWLEFLLARQGRDAPMFLRKWLREAARKENVPQVRPSKPGSVSAAELRALADALRRQSPAAAHRHAALLQLAEAAAAALEGPHAEHWEAVQREQRQLLFACAESADAAASQLQELCALVARSGGSSGSGPAGGGPGAVLPLSLGDLALLVLQAYCLLPDFLPWFAARGGASGGPFTPQQEQQLEEALTEAVLAGGGTGNSSIREGTEAAAAGASAACAASPPWLLEQLASRAAAARAGAAAGEGGSSSEAEAELRGLRLEARDAVQALPARMRELSGLRRSLLKAQQGQQLGRLAALGEDGAPRATPLLRRLVECILRDEPLPDLHAGATSLSGLLRSGLGRLGVKAGPKPSNCPTVILFVLGGISLAELHAIQQAVDERAAAHASGGGGSGGGGGQGGGHAPPRILVGGTALLNPHDLCCHMFADL